MSRLLNIRVASHLAQKSQGGCFRRGTSLKPRSHPFDLSAKHIILFFVCSTICNIFVSEFVYLNLAKVPKAREVLLLALELDSHKLRPYVAADVVRRLPALEDPDRLRRLRHLVRQLGNVAGAHSDARRRHAGARHLPGL